MWFNVILKAEKHLGGLGLGLGLVLGLFDCKRYHYA